MTSPNWLSEMVGCLAYPDVGVVGARLLYPAGRSPTRRRCRRARRARRPLVRPSPGRFSRADGAARGALDHVGGDGGLHADLARMLEAAGPFDEQNFAVAYNDVDFCLRARAAGFRTVYTPFATLDPPRVGDARPRRSRSKPLALPARPGRVARASRDARIISIPCMSPWRDRETLGAAAHRAGEASAGAVKVSLLNIS